MHLKLSKAARATVRAADATGEGSASKVGVLPEDIRGSNEPMAQMGFPVRVAEVTEEESLTAFVSTLEQVISVRQ